VVVQPSSAVYFADCEYCHSRKVSPAQGNELLCEVNEDFIRDEFNLYGLSLQVPFYARAISIIIGEESESSAPAASAVAPPDQDDAAQSSAEILYGLIHARFIMTSTGLSKMAAKYRRIDFGRCARVACQGQPLVPAGESDVPQKSAVKVFCCRCKELYRPDSAIASALDGAYFGCSFPHMFFMQYPELQHAGVVAPYVPRLYGFRIRSLSPHTEAAAQKLSPTQVND
jgi:casein kinase II subunit beta